MGFGDGSIVAGVVDTVAAGFGGGGGGASSQPDTNSTAETSTAKKYFIAPPSMVRHWLLSIVTVRACGADQVEH
jgi:hypothetical protein